jgi:hypothetical protein
METTRFILSHGGIPYEDECLWGYCCLLSATNTCCLLSAVCCLLSTVCCLLSATNTCCLPATVCCLLSAACCPLSTVYCLLSATHCLLPAACYVLSAGIPSEDVCLFWGRPRSNKLSTPPHVGTPTIGGNGEETSRSTRCALSLNDTCDN